MQEKKQKLGWIDALRYIDDIFLKYYSVACVLALMWFGTMLTEGILQVIIGWPKGDPIDVRWFATALGATIVFWYGAKKYERDKELDLVNNIHIKENINESIIDWKAKRVIYEKGYIKEYLWSIYENNYQVKLLEHIGVLKDINYSQEFIETDMAIVVSKLSTYSGADVYFKSQIELIRKTIDNEIEFMENNNIKQDAIVYFKKLKDALRIYIQD